MNETNLEKNKITPSETLELIQLVQQGDVVALEKLYNQNINLIKMVAKKYAGNINGRFDFDDLMQEAYIGFVKAAKTYNPALNLKFSTVAVECMINSVRAFLKHNSSHLKITSTFLNKLKCIKKAYKDLSKDTNVKPTIEEISVITGLSISEILEVNRGLSSEISLDTYNDFDYEVECSGLYEIIPNDEIQIDEEIEQNEEKNNIIEVIKETFLPDFNSYSKEELHFVFEFGRLSAINNKYPSIELENSINEIATKLFYMNDMDINEDKIILYEKYKKLYKNIRQMVVILKRYYTPYGKTPSQEEVSEYFGVSKQMISRIEISALQKLRKKFINSNIDLSSYCKFIKK